MGPEWENLKTNNKTLQLLTSRLMKEESMKKAYGERISSDAAFFAKQSGLKPKGDSSKIPNKQVRFKRKCDYCDGDNHIEEKCWQKASDLKMSQSFKSSDGETQAKFAHHVPSDTQEEPSQDC